MIRTSNTVIATIVLRIEDRLDDLWSLERMAAEAGYEAHHFAHLFRDVVGLPPLEYVRRLRLERAAHDLMNEPEKSLDRIAREAHYGSVAAFRRAFSRAFEQSPMAIRRRPGAIRRERPRLDATLARPAPWLIEDPTVVELGPLTTISLRAERFDDRAIEDAWRAFFPRVWPAPAWTIGAATAPWGFVTESRMRQYRCFQLSRAEPEAPLERFRLERAWYVRFEFRGELKAMHDLFAWIFDTWLVQSSFRYAFAPIVTLFDGQTWVDTRFRDAHARVHVPVRSLRSG